MTTATRWKVAEGQVAWRFRPAQAIAPGAGVRNCVACDSDGRILAALGTDVYALTIEDSGCVVDWRCSTEDHIPGSPVIDVDGNVLVHSSDCRLYVTDTDGEAVRSPTFVGPALGWANPLADSDGCVWINASTGGIKKVDPAGRVGSRPFFRNSYRLDCTGAISGRMLYVGSEDQFIHAIDLSDATGRAVWDQQERCGQTGWNVNSAIALDGNDRIIAVSRDDRMYAFREDGTADWVTELDGRAIGSPIIGIDGMIVVGLTIQSPSHRELRGQLVAIQNTTGQVLWKLEFDAPIESTPVSGCNGEFYFGDNAGKIHCVSPSGEGNWSTQVGSAVRSAGTIVPPGMVVFGLDDGSLVALHVSSETIGGAWPKLLGTTFNRACL